MAGINQASLCFALETGNEEVFCVGVESERESMVGTDGTGGFEIGRMYACTITVCGS